jgi:hypothetical protein
VDQVKTWIFRTDLDLHGIDMDIDAEIKRAMLSVKRQVNSMLKTEYDYVRRLEWYSGEAQNTLMARYYPIVELEYVRMYNIDYQRFFQYAGSEMIVNNRIGTITFPPLYIVSNPYRAMGASLSGFSFFPGRLNVQIVYTTGHINDEVPGAFSEPIAQLTAARLLETAHLRITDGTKSRIINGVQENYSTYWDVAQVWKAEAIKALARYRRISIE